MKKFFGIALFKPLLLSVMIAVLASIAWNKEANAFDGGDDGRVRIGIGIYGNSRNGMTEDDARIITNMLTNALVGSKNIRLYERQQLDAVMQELRLGRGVYMDERMIVELGKVAGLQYMLIGSIDSLGRNEYRSDNIFSRISPSIHSGSVTTIVERHEINIRMLDVATGEVRLSFAEQGSAQDVHTRIMYSSSRETGSLRTRAVRDAMSRLTGRVGNALTKEFASLSSSSGSPSFDSISSLRESIQY